MLFYRLTTRMKCMIKNVRADSHLLELAVNDALIYVIKNYPLFNFDDKLPTQINDVELLLSETKF